MIRDPRAARPLPRLALGHHVAILAMLSTLVGCSASHGRGDDAGSGVRCGPTTCAAGLVCCNASCGICTEPGGACIDLFCEPFDAGEPSCGGSFCGAGEVCCSGCPGEPAFCERGPFCPAVDCPPPPPGCEGCAPGQLCCPGCPGEGSFCGGASSCPDLVCPPSAACDDDVACPGGTYCERSGACSGPGVCRPRPSACTDDCPGVCGCDGVTYCNACDAAASGIDVAHSGACGPTACAGRSYCDCTLGGSGCEPLIDTTTGCVCPCDDPFNCTGSICDCGCGGAEYLGCAPAGACPVTELSCGPGCRAAIGADGCPACLCAAPG